MQVQGLDRGPPNAWHGLHGMRLGRPNCQDTLQLVCALYAQSWQCVCMYICGVGILK